MTRLSEKIDVQNNLVEYLTGIGWDYLPPDEIDQLRQGDPQQPFLVPIARRRLIQLNPDLVTEDNVDDLLARLRRVHPSLAGNEAFLQYLRGQRTVYHPEQKRELNLTLIDYDNLAKNHFAFTQEFRFEDRDARRIDMLLFANGFPVLLIENKSPTLQDPEIDAFDQVQKTYTDRIPELIKFPEIFAACDKRLHYGATWNASLKAYYRWKTAGKDYGLEALSKTFLARDHVLRLLRDYVIFFRADDQTHKFVLRPHQIRATERIVTRVANNLPSAPQDSETTYTPSPLPGLGEERGPGGEERAPTGLIWHTQGSGKTLTMIVAAHKLRRLETLENPTILIVVDRLELENQMLQNLESYGFPAIARAESRAHLEELLKTDYRGLIVTTIHKFHRIDSNCSRRHNIIVLIDEAHRTQEGDLATYMRAALPNAFYFGFTGTPIDRGEVGRGTFETFGRHDQPQGYLDKYSIDESIEDGTTVPLYYTLTPLELRLDKQVLEDEFYSIVEGAGVASIEQLNRILDKAENLKAVLKAPERVDRIAEHIAGHYVDNVEPLGFKAFVVAVDREACALYKQALDRHLPADYTQVVYTRDTRKDDDLLRQHYIDDDEEKRIRKSFRAPEELPKILIVTEKLLTGYDAPVLYCMYLDKPMKDHTLLQAIARVNRPFPTKENGLIVDYIGVFEDLQRALAFDSESVSTGLIDIERLKERFEQLMDATWDAVEPVAPHNPDGRIERIIDYFFDAEVREEFIRLFKELEQAYEILSPDPFLRPYIDDYALLAQIYQVVYEEYNPKAEQARIRRDLLRKTDTLIRQHVHVDSLTDDLPQYQINRDIANVVRSDDVSDRVKVANLHRSLVIHIEQHKDQQPYLISLGERVETVIQQLHDRHIGVQTALDRLTNLAREGAEAQEEQQQSDLPGEGFAYKFVLQAQGVPEPEHAAREVHQILREHADWPYNSRLEQHARRSLYKYLWENQRLIAERGAEYSAQSAASTLKETVDNLLRMHRTVTQQ